MKKIIFFLLLAFFSSSSFGQKAIKAKKKLTYSVVGEGGTNGCSVAYNKDKKIYYASIAGNADYPLETFTAKGKNISTRMADQDLRGVWFNSNTNKLEANCYGETGIVNYSINSDGTPSAPSTLYEGPDHQPSEQSVGAYDPAGNRIYYFSEGEIYVYKRGNGEFEKSFSLVNSPVDWSNYNYNTIVFTGKSGKELGLLNYNDKEVCLFDLNGNYTAKVKLPSNAITNDAFRFSCANGLIWLYDVDSRSWTGYSF